MTDDNAFDVFFAILVCLAADAKAKAPPPDPALEPAVSPHRHSLT